MPESTNQDSFFHASDQDHLKKVIFDMVYWSVYTKSRVFFGWSEGEAQTERQTNRRVIMETLPPAHHWNG